MDRDNKRQKRSEERHGGSQIWKHRSPLKFATDTPAEGDDRQSYDDPATETTPKWASSVMRPDEDKARKRAGPSVVPSSSRDRAPPPAPPPPPHPADQAYAPSSPQHAYDYGRVPSFSGYSNQSQSPFEYDTPPQHFSNHNSLRARRNSSPGVEIQAYPTKAMYLHFSSEEGMFQLKEEEASIDKNRKAETWKFLMPTCQKTTDVLTIESLVSFEDSTLSKALGEILVDTKFLYKQGVMTMDVYPRRDLKGRATSVLCGFGGGFDNLNLHEFGHLAPRLVYCMNRLLYPTKNETGFLGCSRYLPEKGPPGLFMAFTSQSAAVQFNTALNIWFPQVDCRQKLDPARYQVPSRDYEKGDRDGPSVDEIIAECQAKFQEIKGRLGRRKARIEAEKVLQNVTSQNSESGQSHVYSPISTKSFSTAHSVASRASLTPSEQEVFDAAGAVYDTSPEKITHDDLEVGESDTEVEVSEEELEDGEIRSTTRY